MDYMNNQDNFESRQPPRVSTLEPSAQPSQVSPGKSAATTSMILGIIAAVFLLFGSGAVVSGALGIVGLIYAKKAKKSGYDGVARTVGFVLSLIGLIVGCIALVVAFIAFAGILTAAIKMNI